MDGDSPTDADSVNKVKTVNVDTEMKVPEDGLAKCLC